MIISNDFGFHMSFSLRLNSHEHTPVHFLVAMKVWSEFLKEYINYVVYSYPFIRTQDNVLELQDSFWRDSPQIDELAVE